MKLFGSTTYRVERCFRGDKVYIVRIHRGKRSFIWRCDDFNLRTAYLSEECLFEAEEANLAISIARLLSEGNPDIHAALSLVVAAFTDGRRHNCVGTS